VLVHRRAQLGDAGEDRLRARDELRPSRGQLHAGGAPQQERDAELVLQAADLLRQRGLRDVQLVGRARETAVPRDGREVLQLTQFHGVATAAVPARLPEGRSSRETGP
jgi:hypothetical protein